MRLRQIARQMLRGRLRGLPGVRGVLYRIDTARAAQLHADTQRDAALRECEQLHLAYGGMRAEHRAAAPANILDVKHWAQATAAEPVDDPVVAFQCNVCGTFNLVPKTRLSRETSSCRCCGSSIRFRAIVHLVSMALYGRSIPLPDFSPDRSIRGAGLSDWGGYAGPLTELFDFVNTFYHQEPLLDIVAPPPAMRGSLDFLISSDVFEHVPPPVSHAFTGTFDLLKPGGHLILTVPFINTGHTVEHYPHMRDFQLVSFDGDYVVVARNTDGAMTLHPDPVFHGGPGTTLEMRLFSRDDLLAQLADAGFVDIGVVEDDVPLFGLSFHERFGLPILARKPLA